MFVQVAQGRSINTINRSSGKAIAKQLATGTPVADIKDPLEGTSKTISKSSPNGDKKDKKSSKRGSSETKLLIYFLLKLCFQECPSGFLFFTDYHIYNKLDNPLTAYEGLSIKKRNCIVMDTSFTIQRFQMKLTPLESKGVQSLDT